MREEVRGEGGGRGRGEGELECRPDSFSLSLLPVPRHLSGREGGSEGETGERGMEGE